MVRRKYFGNFGNPNCMKSINYIYEDKIYLLNYKKTVNRYKKMGLKPVFTVIDFHYSRIKIMLFFYEINVYGG